MSYFDTCKSAKNDELVALKANVQRVMYTATQKPQTEMKGSFSFDRIQPGDKHNTIKNLMLCARITFKVEGFADDAKALAADFATAPHPGFYFNNINAALYDCSVSINSSINQTQQPYLNNIIYKNFKQDEYVEDMNKKYDKYVSVIQTHTQRVVDTTDGYDTIEYYCMCPIYNSLLEGDLTGVSSLNIRSNYNLNTVIKHLDPTKFTNSQAKITVEYIDFTIYYDNVINTIPDMNETYRMLKFNYIDYSENLSLKNVTTANFVNNVKDVQSAPLRAYNIIVEDIRGDGITALTNYNNRITSSRWDINNHQNVILSDNILSVYSTSKDAGLLTEFSIINNTNGSIDKKTGDYTHYKAQEPVCAITLLNTPDITISTSDLFRLSTNVNVKFDTTVSPGAELAKTFFLYTVYEYPALLELSPVGNTFINGLSGTSKDLIETDGGLTEYMDEYEDMGYGGDGKVADWFRKVGRKIKEGKYVSKILSGISKGAKIFGTVAPMIPGIGAAAPVVSKIGDIAGNVGTAASNAGYSVSMF